MTKVNLPEISGLFSIKAMVSVKLVEFGTKLLKNFLKGKTKKRLMMARSMSNARNRFQYEAATVAFVNLMFLTNHELFIENFDYLSYLSKFSKRTLSI